MCSRTASGISAMTTASAPDAGSPGSQTAVPTDVRSTNKTSALATKTLWVLRPRPAALPEWLRIGSCPRAVLLHQDRRQHLDRPRVEGPVVDDHLHGRAREPPHPIGHGAGAHDDVHAPHQTSQRGV